MNHQKSISSTKVFCRKAKSKTYSKKESYENVKRERTRQTTRFSIESYKITPQRQD